MKVTFFALGGVDEEHGWRRCSGYHISAARSTANTSYHVMINQVEVLAQAG
jgi:hypothetical protein